MYSVGMDGVVLKKLESDGLGTGVVRFVEKVDGANLRIEVSLVGDPLGRGGDPTPFVMTGLTVALAGPGRRLGWEGINGALVRRLPLGRLSEEASRLLMSELRAERGKPARDLERIREMARQGPRDEVLRLVGELYAEALVHDHKPAKAIADQMQLPTSTASRWIRKSRDLGYIPALRSELRERNTSP